MNNLYATVAAATAETIGTFARMMQSNAAKRPAKLSAMVALSGGYVQGDARREYAAELCEDFAGRVKGCETEAALDQFYTDVAAFAIDSARDLISNPARVDYQIIADVAMKLAVVILGNQLRKTARQSAQNVARASYMETGSANALILAASVGLDTQLLIDRRTEVMAAQAEARKRAERNERARQRRAGL